MKGDYYRITFVVRLDDDALFRAENESARDGKANPLWHAGKALCRVLRKRYGCDAKLLGWEYGKAMKP